MTNTPCPSWCTTDHTDDTDADRIAATHGANVGQALVSADGQPDIHVGVFLHNSDLPEDAHISVVHSGTRDGRGISGVTLLTGRNAPAVAELLRVLGHVDIADIIDRAVAIADGAQEEEI